MGSLANSFISARYSHGRGESFFQPFNKWGMIVDSFKVPMNSSWEKQGVLNRLELAQGDFTG